MHLNIGPPDECVPAIIDLPSGDAPLPAVLLVHGLGSTKEQMTGSIGRSLVRRGIATLAVDLPMHGDRFVGSDVRSLVNPIEVAQQWHRAVREVSHALQFLASHADVDRNQIGIAGYSLGAFVALVVAAKDPSIRAVCLAAGGDLPSDIPFAGLIRSIVDPRRIVRDIGGRPLLMVNGRFDQRIDRRPPRHCLPPRSSRKSCDGMKVDTGHRRTSSTTRPIGSAGSSELNWLSRRVDLEPGCPSGPELREWSPRAFERTLLHTRPWSSPFVGCRHEHVAANARDTKADFVQQLREARRRESPAIRKTQQVVLRQQRARRGATNRAAVERRAVSCVPLSVRNAQRNHTAVGEQLPRGVQRTAWVDHLIECVPDRNCVVGSIARLGERDQIAVVRDEPALANECIDVRIHVEPFEAKAFIFRRGEKGSGVASDLESGAAPAECAANRLCLRACVVALALVERREHVTRRRLLLRRSRQPHARVRPDCDSTRPHSRQRTSLSGGCSENATRSMSRAAGISGRSRLLVVLPQELDFALHVVGIRDEHRVRVTADDAMRKLVGGAGHTPSGAGLVPDSEARRCAKSEKAARSEADPTLASVASG